MVMIAIVHGVILLTRGHHCCLADAANAEVIQKLQAENKQLQAQPRPADLREPSLTDLDWLRWSNQYIIIGLIRLVSIRFYYLRFEAYVADQTISDMSVLFQFNDVQRVFRCSGEGRAELWNFWCIRLCFAVARLSRENSEVHEVYQPHEGQVLVEPL